MKPTARLVLRLIERDGGACPTVFAHADLYAYRARISELRSIGYKIGRVACKRHIHRTGQVQAYILED